MPDALILLPFPQSLTVDSGAHRVTGHRTIYFQPDTQGTLAGLALQVAQWLGEKGGPSTVSASRPPASGAPDSFNKPQVILRIDPAQVAQREGYRLTITPDQILVVGHDAAGVFYAAQTLKQILRQCPSAALPCLRILDWPDFSNRGVMLDISRDRVPRMDYLYSLVDMLSEWKINQFQLYTEHTYAYRNHRQVWEHASPMTAHEIVELDRYCRERHIALVPNQNAFGHFERWLKHEPYIDLAAQPDGGIWWGRHMPPSVLNPLDPRSVQLLREMFGELLPHFTSGQFNVGCDETWELGNARTKQACDERGVGRVYLEFLLKILDEVRVHGRTMQFWGDIILKHPELIEELPDDVIAMEWGYGGDHPFHEHCPLFEQAGVPFYVCPGTAAWASIIGRIDIAMANIPLAAKYGRQHGAVGLLNTDWGDHGHHQPPSVSWPGYALGAAMSWAYDANRDIDLASVLNRHVYKDEADVMGQAVIDLGMLHNTFGLFHQVLTNAELSFKEGNLAEVPISSVAKAESQLDAIDERIAGSHMRREDAQLVRAELSSAIDLARHSCRRVQAIRSRNNDPDALTNEQREGLGRHLQHALKCYESSWLARSREGGLSDSVGRSEWLLEAYGVEEKGSPTSVKPRRTYAVPE